MGCHVLSVTHVRPLSLGEEGDRHAVEILSPAQGTPIVGYRNEGGHPVMPKEYDDDHPKDRSGIEQS